MSLADRHADGLVERKGLRWALIAIGIAIVGTVLIWAASANACGQLYECAPHGGDEYKSMTCDGPNGECKTVHQFPGCGDTLQACIHAAESGDRIEMGGIVLESVVVPAGIDIEIVGVELGGESPQLVAPEGAEFAIRLGSESVVRDMHITRQGTCDPDLAPMHCAGVLMTGPGTADNVTVIGHNGGAVMYCSASVCGQATVRRSSFSQCLFGIVAQQTGHLVEGNEIHSCDVGVLLGVTAEATVRRNSVSNCSRGLWSKASRHIPSGFYRHGPPIEGNVLRWNEEAYYVSVEVGDWPGLTVTPEFSGNVLASNVSGITTDGDPRIEVLALGNLFIANGDDFGEPGCHLCGSPAGGNAYFDAGILERKAGDRDPWPLLCQSDQDGDGLNTCQEMACRTGIYDPDTDDDGLDDRFECHEHCTSPVDDDTDGDGDGDGDEHNYCHAYQPPAECDADVCLSDECEENCLGDGDTPWPPMICKDGCQHCWSKPLRRFICAEPGTDCREPCYVGDAPEKGTFDMPPPDVDPDDWWDDLYKL
jgi:hypothetical protein